MTGSTFTKCRDDPYFGLNVNMELSSSELLHSSMINLDAGKRKLNRRLCTSCRAQSCFSTPSHVSSVWMRWRWPANNVLSVSRTSEWSDGTKLSSQLISSSSMLLMFTWSFCCSSTIWRHRDAESYCILEGLLGGNRFISPCKFHTRLQSLISWFTRVCILRLCTFFFTHNKTVSGPSRWQQNIKTCKESWLCGTLRNVGTILYTENRCISKVLPHSVPPMDSRGHWRPILLPPNLVRSCFSPILEFIPGSWEVLCE